MCDKIKNKCDRKTLFLKINYWLLYIVIFLFYHSQNVIFFIYFIY